MSRLQAFAWVVVLALALSDHARAQEGSSRSTLRLDSTRRYSLGIEDLSYKFLMAGMTVSEGQLDDAVDAEFSVNLRMDYRLAKWIKLRFEPRAEFHSSRVQEVLESDEYQTRLRLDNAYVSIKPIQHIELQAGALRQAVLDTPLVVSRRRTFPGLRELVSSEDQWPVRVELMAQQLVPTSQSLNDERDALEKLPQFRTEQLKVSAKHKLIEWEAFGGHYAWTDIPSVVAIDSIKQGNSPLGAPGGAVAGTRLRYGFDGLFWGASACACGEGPVHLGVEYWGMHNNQAPDRSGDAQMWAIAPRLILGSREFELKYYNYFIEPDSTVAKYARRTTGFTNRLGDVVEASVNFKDQGFKVVGQFVGAAPVQDMGNSQRDLTQYSIWVETDYASF